MAEFPDFNAWLRGQQFDLDSLTPELLDVLRRDHATIRKMAAAQDPKAVVRTPPPPGEFRYAVANEDADGLWLTLWGRRSAQGEYFVLYPRGQGDWNPHA